jgi:putative ABC transport system permease protein
VAFGPATLPRLDEVRLNGTAVLFSLGLSALSALLFGAIPLLHGAPLAATLHENGRANTASRARHHARRLLMGGQIALALVLLVASGLMVRSFQNLRNVDPGFDASSALTFRLGLPHREYPDRRTAVAAHQDILTRLSRLPGVTVASASTCLPLESLCFGNSIFVDRAADLDRANPRPAVTFQAIAPDYFEAMGQPLLSGRLMDRAEIERGEPNVVVNKVFADVYFPNQDPIGRRVASSRPPSLPPPAWLTIVGIVANTPTRSLTEFAPAPKLYMPMSIAGGPEIPMTMLVGPNVAPMSYVVRTSVPPQGLVASVRRVVDAVDSKLALADVRTLQDVVDRASAQMAFTMVLLAIAASVALLLGVIGIYGVMSYIVSQRTGEIGVRLALGAEPGRVAGMIVRQGALVALAGIVVGLGAAFAGSRLIESLLFGVGARDPGVFGVTTAILVAVALLACWLPARRASYLSPIEALRTD